VRFIYPNGDTGQMPYYQTFAHIVNHSTYHRGQLVTLLRQAGYDQFSSIFRLFLNIIRSIRKLIRSSGRTVSLSILPGFGTSGWM
jgi:hypothetical protein